MKTQGNLIAIFACLLTCYASSHSQAPDPSWSRDLDGNGIEDRLTDLVTDASGNIYLTGYTRRSNTETDYMTVKLGSDGSRLKVDSLDPGTIDQAVSVNTRGSYVYVTGLSKQGTYYKIVTEKLDATSFVRNWAKTYSGGSQNDAGVIVRAASTGYVYVAGNYKYTSANPDVVLMKYSPDGSTLTTTTLDLGGGETVLDMAIDNNDSVYICGLKDGVAFAAKYTPNLAFQWSSIPSSTYGNQGGIAVDTSGHVFMTAYSGAQGKTIVFRGSDGAILQTLNYLGPDQLLTIPFGISVRNSDRSIYITGKTQMYVSPYRDYRMFTLRYGYSGGTWSQSFAALYNTSGAYGYEYAGTEVRSDDQGNVYSAGTISYTNGLASHDIVLLKYNSSGTLQWAKQYDGYLTGTEDSLVAMAGDNSGNLYLGALVQGSIFPAYADHLDMGVIKFNVGGSFSQMAVFHPIGLQESSDLPSDPVLSQNYPNPFNPTTTIYFKVTTPSVISLRVYDVIGREVATLLRDEAYSPGSYQIPFSGRDLATGVYFYRITDSRGELNEVRRMLLVR